MTAPEPRSSPPPRPNGGPNGRGNSSSGPASDLPEFADPPEYSGPKHRAPRYAEITPAVPRWLLEDKAWLLRVARGLTDDAHLAEDVVQNAYLAALRSPPRDPARRRGWLRIVVRNFIRLSHREETRRVARERIHSRPEAAPPAEACVEEEELRELVATAASELAEPYRHTVIEHFYRGRTTNEIAEEEGIAPNTVRVRVRRALILLTAKLDRRVGGRRAVWLLPLLGLFLPAERLEALAAERAEREGVAPATAGSAPYWRAAAPVAVLGVIVALVVFLDRNPEASGTEPGHRVAVESGAAPSETIRRATHGRPDDELAVVLPSSRIDRLPSGLPRFIAVRNRASGDPIRGADVYLDPQTMDSERLARGRTPLDWLTQPFATKLVGRTDASGRLTLPPLHLGRDRLLVRAPGFLEHRERSRLRRGTEGEGLFEVSLRPAETGHVMVLLPGGTPERDVPVRVIGASGAVLDGLTDREGRFAYPLEEAEHRIEIDLPGFAAVRELALPPEQTITLIRASDRTALVTDARGQPVSEARVTITLPPRTRIEVASDRSGAVIFSAPEGEGAVRFAVEHEDHPRTSFERPLSSRSPFRLNLADAAWVEGIVQGPEGAIADATVLAVPGGPFFVRDVVRVATGLDGRFRLGPLLPGDTLLRIESEDCAAAETPVHALQPFETRTLDVELPRGATLEGRVVSPLGLPLAGVRVQVGAVFGDEVRGPIAESDDDGRFQIEGLPTDPPPLRIATPESRWAAFGDPKAGFPDGPKHGLILQVHAPHQLRAADGVEIPRMSFLGSRNTVALPQGASEIELVVDPWPEQHLPRIELLDPEGFPVRDVVNWLIIPSEDPTDRSRLFAGSDGNPVNVGDASTLEGCWILLVPRRHAVTGAVLHLRKDDAPWQVELWPRVQRTILFRHDDGTPLANADLWWVPQDPEAFAALALGRTSAVGLLTVDHLAPGHYRIVESAQRETPPDPAAEAIAIQSGRMIGVLDVPRGGGDRLEVRVNRALDGGGGG